MANSVPAVYVIKSTENVCWDVSEYIMENQRLQIYENGEYITEHSTMRLVGCCSGGIDDDVIKKATINIAVGEFSEYYGTDKKVTITVTNAKTGEPVTYEVIHLYMPQTTSKDYYFTTNENGISEIGVNQLTAETYSFSVSNNDTTNIEKKTVDGKFTILLKPISLSVTSSLTISYNTEYTATIKVTDKATGKAVSGAILYIKLYTGSKHLDLLVQADKNGIAKFQAPLSVGKHKMVISTDKKYEPRYTAKSVTKTLTVKKASGKISAPKVTTYYKGEKYLNIKLVNTKNNKPIYLAKVNIRVYISSTRYYNYNIQTGYDGKIKLLIDLVPKTYKVEVRSGTKDIFK